MRSSRGEERGYLRDDLIENNDLRRGGDWAGEIVARFENEKKTRHENSLSRSLARHNTLVWLVLRVLVGWTRYMICNDSTCHQNMNILVTIPILISRRPHYTIPRSPALSTNESPNMAWFWIYNTRNLFNVLMLHVHVVNEYSHMNIACNSTLE